MGRFQEEPGNHDCAERVRCHARPASAKQGSEGDGESKRQVRFVNTNDPLERKPHARSCDDGGDSKAVSPDDALASICGFCPSDASPEFERHGFSRRGESESLF